MKVAKNEVNVGDIRFSESKMELGKLCDIPSLINLPVLHIARNVLLTVICTVGCQCRE